MKFFATLFTALSLLTAMPAMAESTETLPAPTIEESIGKAIIDDAKAADLPTTPAPLMKDGWTIVTTDFGGSVMEYIEKYNRWRIEGRKVRVEDDCMSACTFMLGRLDPANVCVTDTAQFAFHSAWQMSFTGPVFAKEATRLMWQYYPAAVRERLKAAGWNSGEEPHPDFIYIKATDFYEPCA